LPQAKLAKDRLAQKDDERLAGLRRLGCAV
jgi:hypothetical protein